MSDDMSTDDVPIKITEDQAVNAPFHGVAAEYASSEEFGDFVGDVLATAEAGTPVAHIISHVVMELFQPSFVMIGSPKTHKAENGLNMPKSLGVAIGGDSDLTRTDLIALLRNFADKLEEASDPGSLFDE